MNFNNSKKLSGVLICPKTKQPLTYDETIGAYVDKNKNVIYDIKEGIPALLTEEKTTFDTPEESEEEE